MDSGQKPIQLMLRLIFHLDSVANRQQAPLCLRQCPIRLHRVTPTGALAFAPRVSSRALRAT